MKKYLFFDLDGTLTDTGEGIMKSVEFALADFGIYGEPREKLRRFVGPPLDWSFREFYHLSQEDAWRAVEKYRERYRAKGVYENALYPGMEALLKELSGRATLCVATSKPQVFAEQILEMRDVKKYFSVVVGAHLDGTRTEKAEVITQVLKETGAAPAEAVMIGDRLHDIVGARKCALESVGVRYGFSEGTELEEAGADFIAEDMAELREILLRLIGGEA